MPSYAAQLSADERWKIVTYVHTTLQGYGKGETRAEVKDVLTEHKGITPTGETK
jgi:mono/diheme cytochrome c family protein